MTQIENVKSSSVTTNLPLQQSAVSSTSLFATLSGRLLRLPGWVVREVIPIN